MTDATDRLPDAQSPDWNYEATVDEIEAIITQIESGELDIAVVFDRFATAVHYLRQCETFLAERRHQMDLLIETLADSSYH
ncbi:MAG: exodeoxyribonuclease VII small subunit [Cyanobacteria bacterium]|nr:exodeoxyribonuclease VII small subunit [Cyanobacteriota bacterium]MDW8200071.1 exodeoxyribonuclease VII small subunit [Cyanobacteriota bacterium SKYGB_h_bin112]